MNSSDNRMEDIKSIKGMHQKKGYKNYDKGTHHLPRQLGWEMVGMLDLLGLQGIR